MPVNTSIDLFNDTYIAILNRMLELINTLADEINTAAPTSFAASVAETVTTAELDTYLLSNPIWQGNATPLGSIDIRVLDTFGLADNTPVKVLNGKLESNTPLLTDITSAIDGYVLYNNGNFSITVTAPNVTTQLSPHEIVYIKNGSIRSFPTSNDTDVIALLAGVNNIPVGSSAYFPSTNVPSGYLIEDGSEVSKQKYPQLFAYLGTSGGASSDPTKFRLRDKRGLFMVGYDSAKSNRKARYSGGASGSQIGSVSIYDNIIPVSHTHSTTATYSVLDVGKITPVYRIKQGSTNAVSTYGANDAVLTTTAVTDNAPANLVKVSTEFRPKNITMVRCIRAVP